MFLWTQSNHRPHVDSDGAVVVGSHEALGLCDWCCGPGVACGRHPMWSRYSGGMEGDSMAEFVFFVVTLNQSSQHLCRLFQPVVAQESSSPSPPLLRYYRLRFFQEELGSLFPVYTRTSAIHNQERKREKNSCCKKSSLTPGLEPMTWS